MRAARLGSRPLDLYNPFRRQRLLCLEGMRVPTRPYSVPT
jgi:hypothetical protein